MAWLALALGLIFIVWMLVRDYKRRPLVSAAIWLPTLLLMIIGSRPLSVWIGVGSGAVTEMGNEVASNPIDQVFFLLVLVASWMVASSRRVKWSKLIAANGALMLFYFFFAVSVSWSGDPSGSAKRLVKDFGLLFLGAVIFSEKDPLQALRAVFVRAACVLFPLSIVFDKYFPSYSRSYSIAGDEMLTGVTLQKNSLGEIGLVLTLFLVWDFLEARRTAKGRWAHLAWDRVALIAMGLWLLHVSQSKTGMLGTLLGVALILRTGWLASRMMNRVVLAGALSLPFLLFFSQQFSSVIAPVVEALGRNMTFTGRTDIWGHINATTVNPILGAGYWNFWGGKGGFAISEAMKTIVPNAHCGYLDIYLDGGLIGLILLFYVLIAYGRRLSSDLRQNFDADRFHRMRFALLIVAIFYNLSESNWARVSPIWMATLLMIVNFPIRKAVAKKSREPQPKPRQLAPDRNSVLVPVHAERSRPWHSLISATTIGTRMITARMIAARIAATSVTAAGMTAART
jgi:exopolysaccharide production protein ExoQ